MFGYMVASACLCVLTKGSQKVWRISHIIGLVGSQQKAKNCHRMEQKSSKSTFQFNWILFAWKCNDNILSVSLAEFHIVKKNIFSFFHQKFIIVSTFAIRIDSKKQYSIQPACLMSNTQTTILKFVQERKEALLSNRQPFSSKIRRSTSASTYFSIRHYNHI